MRRGVASGVLSHSAHSVEVQGAAGVRALGGSRMIQEGTLIEAILGFRSQIDFLWQFFVTVHIAIFALLFIYDEAVES